jgi:hypothetical protein
MITLRQGESVKLNRPFSGRALLAAAAVALSALACNAPTSPSAGTVTSPAFTTQVAGVQTLTIAGTETPDTGQPTATLLPGLTPSPTVCTYNMSFVDDVTVPDGTEVVAGSRFDKTWRLRNNGCLPWPTGTQLVLIDGEPLGAPASVGVPATGLDATVDVTVPMIAPNQPGEHAGYWQLQAPGFGLLGYTIYVKIVVIAATPTPTATAQGTATPTPKYQPFIGTWVNQNTATTNITKLVITLNGDGSKLVVHMWNKGVPGDLDRGETKTLIADADDSVLFLSWVETDLTETQQLSLLIDGRLQVNGVVNFEDARADLTYNEYFNRQQ